MRGSEFLEKMELIDSVYVEEAGEQPELRKTIWIKCCVVAACICLIMGSCVGAWYLLKGRKAPPIGDFILSDKTTAKVSLGVDGSALSDSKCLLTFLTEEEMFSKEGIYVFRGTVADLTNVTVDFNGKKEAFCISTIKISRVYKGEITAGEEIKMLLPCAIGIEGKVEDTGFISQIENGMEGIFMPWVYDENAYMGMLGAVLMLQDLADCGLADGMRWVFLSTERGAVFFREAYPGARYAITLDDVEAYVVDMLK